MNFCRGCKRPASAEAERPPLSAVAMNGSPITRSGRVRRSTGGAQHILQRGQSSQQRQRQGQEQQQQHEQQQRAVRPRTRLQAAGGGAGRSCLGPQEPGPSAEVAGPPAGVDRCAAGRFVACSAFMLKRRDAGPVVAGHHVRDAKA